jgi:hypothetical protein
VGQCHPRQGEGAGGRRAHRGVQPLVAADDEEQVLRLVLGLLDELGQLGRAELLSPLVERDQPVARGALAEQRGRLVRRTAPRRELEQ